MLREPGCVEWMRWWPAYNTPSSGYSTSGISALHHPCVCRTAPLSPDEGWVEFRTFVKKGTWSHRRWSRERRGACEESLAEARHWPLMLERNSGGCGGEQKGSSPTRAWEGCDLRKGVPHAAEVAKATKRFFFYRP